MKIMILALFLFFLNLSVAMVDILGLYTVNVAYTEQWNEELEVELGDEYNTGAAADVATSFGFGDFINGFQSFAKMLFRAVNVSATIRLFYDEASFIPISRLFGLGVGMLYIIGLAQFISNRSTKGMQ